ncbi:hypothetical protein CASFOL_021021 [Castilleja foliolosa]|uniref:WRKY domain-containing protein n=1 Tax=Castilleja foliolosa TaxID=1961234 RepID=A0ABD3D5J9_9LAMI
MNPFTTPIFESSSSSSKNSHTNLLMNMMNNQSNLHHQIFQDEYHTTSINNNNKAAGMMEMFPRSTTSSTIINYNTTRDDVDDDDIDIDEASNSKAITTTIEAAAGKKKGAGENSKCRKPKYAFQTRSQVDILDDGYRWRKYGQKAVKNNKFPRSYYRCTHQGCNVKKQIQRLSKDESIVVTTYEGNHSHPIDKSTDNFEHILTQMQIYTSY